VDGLPDLQLERALDDRDDLDVGRERVELLAGRCQRLDGDADVRSRSSWLMNRS
jgi:hypothetical protein